MVTGTITKPQTREVKPTQFVMIKNAVGGLTVTLEAHDFSAPARRIKFKFDQERNYIPAK